MSNTLGLKCQAERTRNQITIRQTHEAADNLYIVLSVKFLFLYLLFLSLQNSSSHKNRTKGNSEKN